MIFILILLVCFVVLVSFLLALYSMKDFHTKPNPSEYGIFLIRSKDSLNIELFSSILAQAARTNSLISLERLFKGEKKAWVVYGPKKILLTYKEQLNLLELEDYTNVDINNLSIWEVGVRSIKDFKEDLPKLSDSDQFWFQIVLKLKGKNLKNLIPVQLRLVLNSPDPYRLKELTENTQKNLENLLPKLPKPFSKLLLFEFYQTRSFIKEDGKEIKLKAADVLNFGFFV